MPEGRRRTRLARTAGADGRYEGTGRGAVRIRRIAIRCPRRAVVSWCLATLAVHARRATKNDPWTRLLHNPLWRVGKDEALYMRPSTMASCPHHFSQHRSGTRMNSRSRRVRRVAPDVVNRSNRRRALRVQESATCSQSSTTRLDDTRSRDERRIRRGPSTRARLLVEPAPL